MRYFFIAVTGVAIVLGGTHLYKNQSIEVVNNVIKEEVVVEVDALTEFIEEALNASSTEFEIEAQASYDAKLEQLRKEKELEVRKQYRDELNEGIESLEKETGLY